MQFEKGFLKWSSNGFIVYAKSTPWAPTFHPMLHRTLGLTEAALANMVAPLLQGTVRPG